MQNFFKKNIKGIFFATIVGLIAHFLSPYVPGVNGVILAFLLAVVIGNIFTIPSYFKAGISYSSSTLLEYAIIFLAFSISFQSIADLGLNKFLFIIVIILITLLSTIFLAKKFKSKDSTAWLVGFGTAICGSSAIAAVTPMISKNKEDAGIAIAVVNLLGSVGMIALPFLLNYWITDANDLGFVLGASLQSVGNVAGAGAAISTEVMDAALIVKLSRVALLTPAVILFSYLVNRNAAQNEGKKVSFNLPYYLWIFAAITVINSIIIIPEDILNNLKFVGKILLTISMAAIGLKVSFKTLWQSGKMAIGFGLIIFAIQVAVSILFVTLF